MLGKLITYQDDGSLNLNTKPTTDRTQKMIKETVIQTQQQFLNARTHGLSLSQAITILLLKEEPMTTSHINRKIGLTSAAMTGILNKLEARRLVFRQHNQVDRRVITVELTNSGREVALDIITP
jgi:DNA-binding MarR family transcriptional regulator